MKQTNKILCENKLEYYDVLCCFVGNAVILSDGKIVATSGANFDIYLGLLSSILSHTIKDKLAELIRTSLKYIANKEQIILVGPEMAGAILVQMMKEYYQKKEQHIDIGYVCYNGKTQSFDGNVEGKNAIIIEDVLATGTSLCEVTKCLKDNGANVISALYVVDRPEARDALRNQEKKVPFDEINFPVYNIFDYKEIKERFKSKLRVLNTDYPKLTCLYDVKRINLSGSKDDIADFLRNNIVEVTIVGYEGKCSHVCTNIYMHTNKTIILCRTETKKTGTKQRFEYSPEDIKSNFSVALFVENYDHMNEIRNDLLSQLQLMISTVYVLTFL